MQILTRAHEHTKTHGNGLTKMVFRVHLPDERVTTQRRKEGRKQAKEGRKEGENQKEREKEGRKEGELGRKRERRNSYRERGRKR